MRAYITTLTNFVRQDRDNLANHILVLIAFFLPISGKTVDYLYYFLFALYLAKQNKSNPLQTIKENSVILSLVLYVGMYYLWILFSGNYVDAFHYAKESTFLLFSIVIITFLKPEFIPNIITAFILGVFISELVSYALFFELIDGPFRGSQAFARSDNPSPFMYHIHYSFVLAFTTYLLLTNLKQTTSKLSRILTIIFIGTITANLVMNIGRTGYILYVIAIFLFIILYYKKQSVRFITLSVLALSIIAILSYNFSHTFKQRIDTTADNIAKMINENQYNSSIGLRVEKNIMAAELILQRPLLGYGTGQHMSTFQDAAFEQNAWYRYGVKHQKNLDSEYLDITMQFGLVGLFIFLNIFYQLLKYPQPNQYLKNVQIVFVVFYLLFSIANVGVIHHKLADFFLFFISITLVASSDRPTEIKPVSVKELILYLSVGGLLYIRSLFHLTEPIQTFFNSYFA